MLFSNFEQEVVNMLLEGNHPGLLALREQFKASSVAAREITSAGFFLEFSLPSNTPRTLPARSFEINDVVGEINAEKISVGFVLYIKGGSLELLEGFTYNGNWPEQIVKFQLNYRTLPRHINELTVQPKHN